MWLGHYDAMQPAHAIQHRIDLVRDNGRVSQASSLTLTANFLAMQVFAYRNPAGQGTGSGHAWSVEGRIDLDQPRRRRLYDVAAEADYGQ